MCLSHIDLTARPAERRLLGFKIVRKIRHRTYKSGVSPHNRTVQGGFFNPGKILKYRSGAVTEAPVGSPGIYVYLERPCYRERCRVIAVAIPKGTLIRYGTQNGLHSATAAKVKVLGVLPRVK